MIKYLSAAAAVALLTMPGSAAIVQYRANLTALNNSGVSGQTDFYHDTSANTLRVVVNVFGTAPDQVHPQHVHGLFDPNSCTDTAQSGPAAGFCLDGTASLDSSVPTIANDQGGLGDMDGYVETLEGATSYGPIILNLSDPGMSDNLTAFPTSDALGNLTFEATYDLVDSNPLLFDPVFGIKHEVADLFPLTDRVYVIHGVNVLVPGGGMYEVQGDTTGYVQLLPAAAGTIELVSAVPEPGALGLLGLGLAGFATARVRRRS